MGSIQPARVSQGSARVQFIYAHPLAWQGWPDLILGPIYPSNGGGYNILARMTRLAQSLGNVPLVIRYFHSVWGGVRRGADFVIFQQYQRVIPGCKSYRGRSAISIIYPSAPRYTLRTRTVVDE